MPSCEKFPLTRTGSAWAEVAAAAIAKAVRTAIRLRRKVLIRVELIFGYPFEFVISSERLQIEIVSPRLQNSIIFMSNQSAISGSCGLKKKSGAGPDFFMLQSASRVAMQPLSGTPYSRSKFFPA
jgi:hypothetical protein